MAKATRETMLKSGEQLLAEWQLGDESSPVALSAALGRDAGADLAIAERLGHRATADSVAALHQLEHAAADKLVRKEAKRSLYRLEQKGVDIQRPSVAPPQLAEVEPAAMGYVSAIDGRGDQLIWITRSQAGTLLHVFAVINDPLGLKEVELAETSRRGLRALRAELVDKHDLHMIEADWRYCDFLIDRALRWSSARGLAGGDYFGIRARITSEPVREHEPMIRTLLDATETEHDPSLLTRSLLLMGEPELRTWILGPDDLRPYLEEWREIRASPLVLTEEQQSERLQDLTMKAVETLFGGELQASWGRRLEAMAHFFHATRARAAAKSAFAAALALGKSEQGGRGIPVFETLTQSCLAAYVQMAEQQRADERESSLIVTPSEAVQEAEGRKRSD